MALKNYLSALFLRFFGIAILVFSLIALVPGDSRSYFSGAFETSGLNIKDRHINPWTLSYMSFHFGEDWMSQLLLAFGRSLLLASLAAVLSLVVVCGWFYFLNAKRILLTEVGSGFFLSLVSVLVAPLLALFYLRMNFMHDIPWVAFFLAAVSISFVGIGSYFKFLAAKYSQIEYRELWFGLKARGISKERFKWVHLLKLILPDFLVLFLSRYASYIAGVFVAELVFNLKGLGWYFSIAFQSRSGLMLLFLVLLTSLSYLLLNHGALYLAAVFDPRRRREF